MDTEVGPWGYTVFGRSGVRVRRIPTTHTHTCVCVCYPCAMTSHLLRFDSRGGHSFRKLVSQGIVQHWSQPHPHFKADKRWDCRGGGDCCCLWRTLE